MLKIVRWSKNLWRRFLSNARDGSLTQRPAGYLVVIAAAACPFVFRQFVAWRFGLPVPPFMMFSPVILLVALAYGFWAGLLTTLLVALMEQFWIIHPASHSYSSDAILVTFFLGIGIAMSLIASYFRSRLCRIAVLEREQDLRTSRDRLQAILRDSRDIIYRFNLLTQRYEYISPAVQSVLGYSADLLSNHTYEATLALVHPDDREMFLEQGRRVVTFGRTEYEYRHMASDGQYRWLSVIASCTLTEDGTPLYREGFARDITEKKKTEEALLRNATLASVGRTVAAIAHEINNPLAAVTNLLFLAGLDKNLPTPVRGYLEQADAELQRIAHITRQTLGFYREVSAPETVQLDRLFHSVIDLFKRRIETRHAALAREWDQDLRMVGVAGELRQVFSNLLANSLDAIDDDGMIRICARRGTHRIHVAFSDNGKGIEASLRGRVFEPFFTTKGSVGTGLGLWVTHQLVEKNGGSIHLRSVTAGAHRGTLFLIDLPPEPPATTAQPAAAEAICQST